MKRSARSYLPSKWTRLPNRDDWLPPGHRQGAVDQFSRHLRQLGTTPFLFLSLSGVAHLPGEPVRPDKFR
jgi:hypothetical protein